MGRDIDFALTLFNFAPLTAADLDVRARCQPRRLRPLGPDCYQDQLIGPNQTDCFRVNKSYLRAPVVKSEDSAVIAIVTHGAATLSAGGLHHRLRTYDKFFLPAQIGPVTITPDPEAEILECLPPL
jgi:mannose-6-phosphate isomerase